MPTHVMYLIRHASRFDYSNPELWRSLSDTGSVLRTDPPLSPYGEKQTVLCADYVSTDVSSELSSLPKAIFKVRSSFYWRVIQTASPLVNSLPGARVWVRCWELRLKRV